MKISKLISLLLVGSLLIAPMPARAAETVATLYSGEASAEAWTCPVTLPVADRSLYIEGNSVCITCDADAAPYLALISNSGGSTWAQVQPDSRDGDMFFYSYGAMADAFGTDFTLLDYVSVMAATSPITLYSVTIVSDNGSGQPDIQPINHDARVVGYLPDWVYTIYGSLDFSALTHINIAFVNPNASGELFCNIPSYEMSNIVTKAHASGTKVFAALGGAGGCDNYLSQLDTPAEMADFNEKIIAYCQENNLDGIDLDIEFGASHEIWNVYADWVSSLRVLCDENGYELSTATAQWVSVNVSSDTFALFDFLNVMAYDNEGSPTSHADMAFAQTSLDYFNIQRGIPKDKLVLGVPFYGRGYNSDGSLDWNSYVPFSDLIADDAENYNADSFNGIAFNGAPTMRLKCELGAEYGGIMIWELSQDAAGEYSLLAVIKDELTVLAGDVNKDDVFDSADVAALNDFILTGTALANPSAAELCIDGELNACDLCVIKRMLIEAA